MKKKALITTAGVVGLAGALVLAPKLLSTTTQDRYAKSPLLASYDFIVVGGGSAGCVVAARLAQLKKTVLLIEAGPDDATNPEIKVPLAAPKNLNSKIDWSYRAQKSENTTRDFHRWPSGKVLGGSGSLNMMIFVRGNKEDYNVWAEMGCEGWGFNDVLPYFKKLEDYDGAGELRAKGGPMPATTTKPAFPVSKMFVEASKEIGIKEIQDYNGEEQLGVSYLQRNVSNGQRVNTAEAYLRRALNSGRSNLTVVTSTHVSKILIENSTAVGVEIFRDKKLSEIRANCEVIVCAGAVASPKLLLLSGIGPKSHLESIGIEVKKDLPGVGANLRDHLMVSESWETFEKIGLDPKDIGLRDLMEWKLFKTGIFTCGGLETHAILKTDQNMRSPDIQLHFVSVLPVPDAETKKWIDKGSVFASFPENHEDIGPSVDYPSSGNGFCIAQVLLHPESTGTVRLFSKSPFDPPVIAPNYLSNPKDIQTLMKSMRICRRLVLETNTFKNKIKRAVSDYSIPHPFETDEYLINRIKSSAATLYHPAGTCKMGTSADKMAVVDPKLKVFGISNLRVIDASIMPTLVSGNTNIPTIMIAEKGSDLIVSQYQSAAL